MNPDTISQYEKAFGQVVDIPYAYSFWKGRVAFFAILRALGIGHGDEVILPGFTCVVVPNSIRMSGAVPVYADICSGTYNLDPDSVERLITDRTRALIVQHTFGIPADMDCLVAIARRHNIVIIEDCAHALGSTFYGQKVGTFGVAAFFSSQWSKPYTTGFGGLAVTSDPQLAKELAKIQGEFSDPPTAQLLKLRIQYKVYRYFFSSRLYWKARSLLDRLSDWKLFLGSSSDEELRGEVPNDFNWTMSKFQAKIGMKQLSTLSKNQSNSRQLAEFYRKALEEKGWEAPHCPGVASPELLRYPVRVGNKWELLEAAKEAQIEIGSWFESVLHPNQHSLMQFGYQEGQCPIAEKTANEVVNLPLHHRLSVEEATYLLQFFFKVAILPKPLSS